MPSAEFSSKLTPPFVHRTRLQEFGGSKANGSVTKEKRTYVGTEVDLTFKHTLSINLSLREEIMTYPPSLLCSSKVIPVAKFPDYVSTLAADQNRGFSMEYEVRQLLTPN